MRLNSLTENHINDQTSLFQVMLTRTLLAGSFVVFGIGAAGPAFGGVWTGNQELAAHWIVAHPGGWTFATSAFIVSMVMSVTGLAIFSEHFLTGDAQFLGKAGFYTFTIGALMWILVMGYRLGVAPLGAELLVETGALPEYLTPVSVWETALFDIFEAATFLASSIFGVALLKTRGFSTFWGWFAVVYGVFGVVAPTIPIMVLFVPLVMGLSPLPESSQYERDGK